ncbi:cytochrome P450 [Kitasatospora sp. NBC_01287]|uniref:cytochrome P450 n=1 Tax=Kitasatospora sp. NBC_01287 TaxID=2903573 RepID=UPI00225B5EFB|nr:cytochrome P450 [Kitasatospora sp. NBC_01287]MCX4744835.1 cytochrome P450 [Kitasatospora sp. NBC_01287]
MTDPVAQALAALRTPQGSADPYPHLAVLRELSPVHPTPGGGVLLTRYEDCVAITRDPGFHAQNAAWMDTRRPNWREHPGLRATTESFLFLDPPEHTRLRKLVAGAFTQRRAVALREFITGLTDRVLDAIADAGADGSPVDLHEILAARLPIGVIGQVLGVPEADQGALREPLEGLRLAVDGGGVEEHLTQIDRAGEALTGYFGELAARRRAEPADDVTSALVAAMVPGPDNPRPLTQDELEQTLTLVFSAAIESMVDTLLNGLAALLAHPAQADLLRADPSLVGGAVEEMLRYDTPVQGMARVAAKETEIAGVPVAAGGAAVLMLGAANRDPAAFPDPDTFDLTRTGGATVLSFGGGVHHCLGAPLARTQAAVFFPALLSRFPHLAAAGPPVRRGTVLRGFSDFPVTLR